MGMSSVRRFQLFHLDCRKVDVDVNNANQLLDRHTKTDPLTLDLLAPDASSTLVETKPCVPYV